MIQAGKIDKRITIQRLRGDQTAMGNEDPSLWFNVDQCWAGFVPRSGSERMTSFQEIGVGMELIRIRYFPGLTRKDRLKWHDTLAGKDRYYDIQDIQEFPQEREQIVIALEVT